MPLSAYRTILALASSSRGIRRHRILRPRHISAHHDNGAPESTVRERYIAAC